MSNQTSIHITIGLNRGGQPMPEHEAYDFVVKVGLALSQLLDDNDLVVLVAYVRTLEYGAPLIFTVFTPFR